MERKELKTIDVQAKEWFDKVNGNSYCSIRVVLNYGMDNEETLLVRFTYGYGDYYKQAATEAINNYFNTDYHALHDSKLNNVIIRSSIKRNCRKKDVLNWTL